MVDSCLRWTAQIPERMILLLVRTPRSPVGAADGVRRGRLNVTTLLQTSRTYLAFTFHSDGERMLDSQFHSPTICRTTFADNLTRSRISGDDDSNLGGATCDSADFRFTFHTESSQVHFDSDMRREGGSDFRFSDCDSVSATLTLRTVPLSFHT